MGAIFAGLTFPLILLNTFGGLISGIWLVYLGHWRPVVGGLVVSMFAPTVLGLVMMPGGLLFGAPGVLLAERGRIILATPLVFLSLFYVQAVVAVWCLGVFSYFMGAVNADTVWPYALWSYSVAIGPFSYLAGREVRSGGGEGATMTVFFAEIAFIAMAVTAFGLNWPLADAAFLFITILVVSALFQAGLTIAAGALNRSRV